MGFDGICAADGARILPCRKGQRNDRADERTLVGITGRRDVAADRSLANGRADKTGNRVWRANCRLHMLLCKQADSILFVGEAS